MAQQAINLDRNNSRIARMERERNAFASLSFVDRRSPDDVDYWRPLVYPSVNDAEGETFDKRANAMDAVGTLYAIELIDHLREFSDFDDHTDFVHIIESLCRRGEFRTIERSFLHALASYIARGTVTLPRGFEAKKRSA